MRSRTCLTLLGILFLFAGCGTEAGDDDSAPSADDDDDITADDDDDTTAADDDDDSSEVTDEDGDGWSVEDGDCDDTDPAVHPEAEEVACDGIDNDCDGSQHEYDIDDDGDGVTECDGDGDDADPDTYPGADEIPCNGIDNDCDGRLHDWDTDDDGDGVNECDGDCDDADAGVHPGATEICNDIDDDCDGDVDEGFDLDLDGFMGCAGDCDDGDDQINPDALEICDGVDNNCDGNADEGVSDLGGGYDCPALSCFDVLQDQLAATDDTYWIGEPGPDAIEVYCDMTGGGWTLVYRATNSGVIENVDATTPDAYGSTPITPWVTGEHKLHDDVVNDMRAGAVLNDLSVVIYFEGALLGQSWHPSGCALQTGTTLPAADICNSSTTTGPDATDYIQSGHQGTLTRWYVDADFGFIWLNTHIGPVPGGTPHYGNLPEPYCTWYDHRTCPGASAFEIWVQ